MKPLILIFSLQLIIQISSWCLTTTLHQNANISEVDWAPDNSIFVTANYVDKAVRVYDTKSYQLLKIYNTTTGEIPNSVKISKDSKHIGIGYANSQLHVLNISVGYPLFFSFSTNQTYISQVDFSYDFLKVQTCGGDGRYRGYLLAGTNTRVDFQKPTPNGNAVACRLGPLGHIGFADASNRMRVFDIPNSNAAGFSQTYANQVTQLDFFRNSNTIGTVSKDFNFRKNNAIVFTDTNQLLTISVGRAGDYIAIGGKSKILRIFNQSSNSLMAKFGDFKDEINSIKISPDQKSIIVGDKSGQIRIYSTICRIYTCESGQYNNSGVCKKCYETMPKCLKCVTGTVCQYCMAGFYASGSTCLPCYTTLDNCLMCQDAGTCLHCLDGTYLNTTTGKCVKCSDTLTGCTQCNDSTTCTQCFHLQFYVDNNTNQCKPCYQAMTNCLKCYDQNSCTECQIGFYQNGNNNPKCKQCPNDCLSCQTATNCTYCKNGYWANGTNCSRCLDSKCVSCNSTGFCLECQEGTLLTASKTCSDCTSPCASCHGASNNCTSCLVGYYFDSTNYTCQACIQNCRACNQSGKCLNCFPGFKLNSSSSLCNACSSHYGNCSECTSTKCFKCIQGFYVDIAASNICKTCISTIPRCMKCYNSSRCQQCVTGFYNSGLTGINACAACAPGCLQCITGTNCTSCFSTYYLNSSNVCIPCQKHCLQCINSSSCVSCTNGYYLDANTCQPCKTSIPYCQQCFNNITCSICAPGTYLDTIDNDCKLCSLNCSLCNNTDCLSCQVGYYLTSTAPNYCLKCSLFCQQCVSDVICTSCIDGYYFDSNDSKCKNCALSFPHCTLCNKTICLQCSKGSQLNITNNKCQTCKKHISNCRVCYWDNLANPAVVKCSLCNYGFGLMPNQLSCSQCNDIKGCIQCRTSTECTKCQIGYYLKNDSTCGLCASKCQTCDDSLTCLTCLQGYVYDSNSSSCELCQDKIQGCSYCIENGTNNFKCIYCQVGYYLQVLDGICYLCSEQLQGCYTCNSSNVCTSCLDKYYINTGTNVCEKCSYSSAMYGCDLCNSSTVCLKCSPMYYLQASDKKCYYCANNISGCLYCKNQISCSQCNSGYYLTTGNLCALCESQIQGCNYCSNDTNCLLCRTGYYLSTLDYKCYRCNQTGCEVCSQKQSNSCVTCNSKFYLSGMNCLTCRSRVSFCQTCTATDCLNCQVGYYLNSSTSCQRCSLIMKGCSRCSDSSTCLQCMSSYFLNSSNLCQQCNTVIAGCQNCLNQTMCISCSTNFFLNSTDTLCQPCTDKIGCLLCRDENACVLCQQKYLLNYTNSECILCSYYMTGCFSCATNAICIQCESGYVLDTTSYQCIINVVQAKQKVSQLKLISYYISPQMLKHILYAKGMNFNKIDINTLNITDSGKTKLFVEDFTGMQAQLNILWYEYSTSNDYSIIFYTDNPLDSQIKQKSGGMKFRRLLVLTTDNGMQLNLQVLLKMDQSVYNQILPGFDYQGSMTVGYSLNDPQFVKSYMKTQQGSYMKYQIFGMLILGLFLLNIIIKLLFTVPQSKNRSYILPHIIAIKCCSLVLYPTYFQYMNFCMGFMVVDIPWLNSSISQYLVNKSDFIQIPFGLFFDNMNIGATFVFAFSIYGILYLLIQGYFYVVLQKQDQKSDNSQSQISSQQQRNKNLFQIKRIQKQLGVNYQNQNMQNNKLLLIKNNLINILWNLAVFSVVYYSCLGVEGAYYNPISFISVYGVFYILSIFMFLFISIETLYSFLRNQKNIHKLRVYLKACLLCLAHLNPIYIISVCIVLDMSLAVIEFYYINKKNTFTKILICMHMLPNICLAILIFATQNFSSLSLSGLFLTVCFIVQVYIHFRQYQNLKLSADKLDFQMQDNEQKIQQNSQIIQQNEHQNKQFQRSNLFGSLQKQNKFKDMDMFATTQQFGNTKQEDNMEEFGFQHQKRQTLFNESAFSTKKGFRRNKIKKAQNSTISSAFQVIFQNKNQQTQYNNQ